MRLLDAFQSLGIAAPLIHGGALRDHFLGIPHKDIDVRMPFSLEELDTSKSLSTRLSRSVLFNKVSKGDLMAMGDIAFRCRIDAEFEGHRLDIVQDTECPDIERLIQIADGAINAIVIDPVQKCFRAHPFFEAHVHQRIYAPNATCRNIEGRFSHLAGKIPALRFMPGGAMI